MLKKAENLLAAAIITALTISSSAFAGERLVILHTNDTHSQIDPNEKNLGGILRRKALIDSVRRAEKNVLLVDAGDAVQGTLYFSLFGGEVEQMMMNELDYDIQIVGNHEFDNGTSALARMYSNAKPELLSSNYDFRESELNGMFKPYAIREIGDKKIGLIAINLIPQGMIDEEKSSGIKYLDGLKAANSYAWYLKNVKDADIVIALTHIGYENEPGYADCDIATQSSDIDIIIGGHSHTCINPADKKSKPWRLTNANGDTVLVAQTGKSGIYIGEIDIDLDTKSTDYKLITVDKRLDDRIDKRLSEILKPYRAKVDSVCAIKIGNAAAEFDNNSDALLNLISDFVHDDASRISGKPVDMAIMNKGGIRRPMTKGDITKGEIMQILPFDNYIVVLELSGSDLMDALNVMAKRGGDGVSYPVKATYDISTGKCITATIDGKPVDPQATYRIATINYLANGGDYMTPLKRGKIIAKSEKVVYDDLINYFEYGAFKNKKLKPDNTKRMKEAAK